MTTTNVIVLDPTSEPATVKRETTERVASIEGLTIGLLDISKARGDVFLNHVEELLTQRGAIINRYKKPTFTKLAPVDLRHEIAQNCSAVIEALAD